MNFVRCEFVYLHVIHALIYIFYVLSPWILGIIQSMNRLLNRTQWEKSNDSTSVGIRLILMMLLMIEMYSLIQMQQNTMNLYTKSLISQWIFNIFNHWLNHWIYLNEMNLIIYLSINSNTNWWSWSKISAKSMLSRKWIKFLYKIIISLELKVFF